MKRTRVALVAAAALVMWGTEPAAAAEKTCLTGNAPEVASDRAEVTALRRSIDDECPCASFNGLDAGQKRGDYMKCARSRIEAAVAQRRLRPQCKGPVKGIFAKSTCGRAPTSRGEQVPCVKTRAGGRVSCVIKPDGACTDYLPSFAQSPCPRFEFCSDAADSNGDGLIDAGDDGSCSDRPKNVILVVGDGMGLEQVAAAGMYWNGAPGTMSFEFPDRSQMTTFAANAAVTDSAASASAMATGRKVENIRVSVALPGDGSDLETVLERMKSYGKSTGLVTTSYVTDATPAAFGAHAPLRCLNTATCAAIAADYLNGSRPNVLFGGGANGMSSEAAAAAGYTVVTTRAEMLDLDPDVDTMVSGQFGTAELPYEYDFFVGTDDGYDTIPHLLEMTQVALAILERDPDGFFLLVENELTDTSGHLPNGDPALRKIERNVFETRALADTVEVLLDWAEGRDDTLIVVTSDHETGGLTVLRSNGAGVFPDVTWSTSNHTEVPVGVFASGTNAARVTEVTDNTDIHGLCTFGYP